MHDDPTQQGLTSQQKTGFVFLLIFGFLAVGLGMLQVRNTIYGPFIVRKETDQNVNAAQAQLEETMRLQRVDTDRDGLTDYEEMNFYSTSPYLPDTDSDSASDYDEVKGGTDPLCPEGDECGGLLASSGSGIAENVSVLSPLVNDMPELSEVFTDSVLGGAGAASASTTTTELDISALLDKPDELRKMLLESGKISKEVLDTIDDEMLITMALGVANAPSATP